MTPEELLYDVSDRESFIAFVQALAAERDAAQHIERQDPVRFMIDGHFGWKSNDISTYLYACLDYFEDRPLSKPESAPSWRMFADFLYFGKIIE
jgi:hypothetical protein